MSLALWGIQLAMAVVFLMAGAMKLVRSREQLAPKMGWVEDHPPGRIRAIGGAEVLGAVGLLLPDLVDTLHWVTGLAAACLAVLMLGAVLTHARRQEHGAAVVPLVLALLTGFVAYGRFAGT